MKNIVSQSNPNFVPHEAPFKLLNIKQDVFKVQRKVNLVI